MKGDMILIQLVTRLLSMARMANTQAFWQKSSTLTTLPTEKINKFVLLKTQFILSYPTKRCRNVDVTVVYFVRINQLVEHGAS